MTAIKTAIRDREQPTATDARLAPEPILGPTAKLAIRAARDKRVSRDAAKLLILLAAFRDAGELRPPVFALARRLDTDAQGVDRLLKELACGRLVWVTWRPPRTRERNRYALLFAGDKRPGEWALVIPGPHRTRLGGDARGSSPISQLARTSNLAIGGGCRAKSGRRA